MPRTQPPVISQRRLAFIGAGNMASALVDGLLGSSVARPESIVVTDVRPERLQRLRERWGVQTRPASENALVAQQADTIVLATKPQVFDRLLPQLAPALGPDKLVVSIAAGVPLDAIAAALPPGTRLVRAMPNTPALVGEGATALVPGPGATERDVAEAVALFESVGIAVVLDDEALLDTVTGLSGSGPAYLFMIIEALSDAGVEGGLDRETALRLSAQTVLGAARLLLHSGEHPGRLKDMVTSPGGTAIVGLHTLEAGGLRTTLMDAVAAATQRARQLGEQARERLQRLAAGSSRRAPSAGDGTQGVPSKP